MKTYLYAVLVVGMLPMLGIAKSNVTFDGGTAASTSLAATAATSVSAL